MDPLEGGQGVPVGDVGVDEVAEARLGGIAEGVPGAIAPFGVDALQNAQLVGEVPGPEGQHAADPGGEVGAVGLEAAGRQGFGEALARPEPLVHGVRLVPVGDDELVLVLPQGGVDDEAGVLHPAGVEGLRIEGPVPLDEDPVPGVVAAAHDEVGRDGLGAVGGLADEDAPAHVGVAGNQGLDVVDAIDVHRCLLKFY